MNTPPNDVYRKPFRPESDIARTADGVQIRDGLRVFTNNLDRGEIDLTSADWEWNSQENRYHLWFDVRVDISYSGQPVTRRYSQSDDWVATRFKGKTA